MKYLITLLFAVLNVSCIAQNHADMKSAWLPEKYVYATQLKDTAINDYLKPVEGFENPFTDCYILTYRGELNPIDTEKVTINGKEKYKLLNFPYYINLKYNPRKLADELLDASVYISLVNEKLLLEIIRSEKKEEIYFINKINGYDFKSLKEAKEYLMKE